MGRRKRMRLSERLARLDDNDGVRGIIWLCDHFGWWWNLAVGLGLVIAGTVLVAVGADSSDVLAAYASGTAGLILGALLTIGRRKRAER